MKNCPVLLALSAAALLFSKPVFGQDAVDPDAGYIERFHKTFKQNEPALAFEQLASVELYDREYLGDNLKSALSKVSNDKGGIAWGLAYRMISLNEMYRLTKDAKYLEANLECIHAVMAARDDKRDIKLWNDTVVPAWSSDGYAKRGRAVFGVHTGMITYPMLDFLFLSKQNSAFVARLGGEFQTILASAEEALAYHDRQWRDGPGEGEGHYIMLDQEEGTDQKPKPGNRLSALGRALWLSWKVTDNSTHRDHARAIAMYIKRRLTVATDGAYYWPYWLPLEPVTSQRDRESVSGEDVSHGALTVSFPVLLASEGEVFTPEDMKRFGETVIRGFGRKGGGILFGDVTGRASSNPELVASPAKWLPLTQWSPDVKDVILSFYTRYFKALSPIEIAILLRYGGA